MLVVFWNRNRPRHAVEPTWRQHGRRVSRRALLIVGIALVGGPLTYIVLPVPVAAQPAAISKAPDPALAALAVRPALVGGVVEDGDLLSDPVGVIQTGVQLTADGALIGWPVTDHTPSTGFGYRSDPFTHRQRWHDGVDLGQPCGDPAWASVPGTVTHAGWAGGYGNRVVLKHADRDGRSFATTYNHLARIDVAVGEVVEQGDVVGRIGSTGRSTACHMHFEVILDGSYVDPMRFLTGDTSKAGLSRRVGSFMPAGLPSPRASATPTATRTPSATSSASQSPSATSSSPTSPSPTSPSPTSPSPTSPSPTSPSPTSPSPTSPSPTSPSPTSPSPSSPSPTPTTLGSSQTATSPAPTSPRSGTPNSSLPSLTTAAQTPTDATPTG